MVYQRYQSSDCSFEMSIRHRIRTLNIGLSTWKKITQLVTLLIFEFCNFRRIYITYNMIINILNNTHTYIRMCIDDRENINRDGKIELWKDRWELSIAIYNREVNARGRRFVIALLATKSHSPLLYWTLYILVKRAFRMDTHIHCVYF